MQTIVIKTQEEFDKLPDSFDEFTVIEIRSNERIVLYKMRDNSRVTAWGNSQVVAWGNSRVTARDNSQVVAWGNSRVTAWGNSQVVAHNNSQVEAWGNSQVEARDNSRVEAWDNTTIYLNSYYATVTLYFFACCWKLADGKIEQKSKTSVIIEPKDTQGVDAWLEKHGIKPQEKVILYKRVSKDFKTREGGKNETDWSIGKELVHPNWKPADQECGEGKFHACPKTYFCDEFRDAQDDKYIAIEIAKEDLFTWDNNPRYPHKIVFRTGKVLYECDKWGEKIESK